MKMIKPGKQLYYNIYVTVLVVSYSFFLDPSYFFMSVKIDYLNFHEKDMTIFAEKKKNAQRKKEKDTWIQITNQVNVLVVSEMAGVFGY